MKKETTLPVILSEAKNLAPFLGEMLHFVQHDKGVVAGVSLKREAKKKWHGHLARV